MTLTIEDKKFLMSEVVKMYSYATAAAGNIGAAAFVLDTYRKLYAAICEGDSDTVEPKCFKGMEGWAAPKKPFASDLIAPRIANSSFSYVEQLRKFLELESTARLPFSDWDRLFLAVCDETKKILGR